jgi:hypothetical protein
MHQLVPLKSNLLHLGHQISIIYTRINLIKLFVVEINGVWWNETWWIGLVDWIGGIIGLMELLV